MKIQNITNQNFEAKYQTSKILQITSQKIFEPDGMSGFIKILKELNPNIPRYTGGKGYKYYAQDVATRILKKYPELMPATEQIKAYASRFRFYSSKEFRDIIKPILDDLDTTIDIII